MSERDRKAFEEMLEKVRVQGRAPSMVLHLSAPQAQWSVRASMMNAETGSLYLFQISQLKGPTARVEKIDPFSTENIVQRFPDGFAVVDSEGIVHQVNDAFLEIDPDRRGKRHARPKNVALAVATRRRHLRGLKSGMQAWIRESTRHDIGGRVRHKLGS